MAPWYRWDAGAADWRLFQEGIYEQPSVGSNLNIAVIGDSTVYQGGPGPTNIKNALIAKGWTSDRVWVYGVSGKPLSSADEAGQTTAQTIANARAYFSTRGGEPTWLINLGANNASSSDATNTTQLNNLLTNLSQYGAKVLFTGVSQADSYDATNRNRWNRLSRTIVDRRTNCEWFDWNQTIKGYDDTTGYWNSDGVHNTALGYAIKNAWFASIAGRPADLAPLSLRPEGAGYQRYEDLFSINNTIQDVINKVSPGNVLTFPEGIFEITDFAYAGGTNGARMGTDTSGTVCRGIAGSGEDTVFRIAANSSTKNPGTGSTNPLYLFHIWKQRRALYMNFTVEGLEQGHEYNGIRFSYCPGAVASGLKFIGANPGSGNYPPYETFGLNVFNSDNVALLDSEFDGRNRAGVRKSASPFGWNTAKNAYVRRTYVHHAKAGMPTWWETTNIHTVDLVSERNGSGSGMLNGQGINHEKVGGVIRHIRPDLTIARSEGNTGLHFSLNNSVGAAGSPAFGDATDVALYDVTHDATSLVGGAFTMQTLANYHPPQGQTQTSFPIVVKNGVTLTPRDAADGTGSPNPATQFFRFK